MPPGFLVRPARPGDEAALTQLFSRAFGRSQSEEGWRWKLGRWNAAVPSVWVAEHKGDLVCQYAGMPAAAQLCGRDVGAMIAVDAMTAPEHRRKGLLTEVVTRAHEAWGRGGVAFVLGLPNEQWGSRSEALGWRPLFKLSWLSFPLRSSDVLRRRYGPVLGSALAPLAAAWFRRPAGPADGVLARTVDTAGPLFDVLWKDVRAAFPSSLFRDGSWVGWRFLAAPDLGYRVLLVTREGRPLGWSAVRVDRSRGHGAGLVADLVAAAGADPSAFGHVVEASLLALDAAGAQTASTLAVEGTARFRRFLERGFLRRPHGFEVHAVVLDPAIELAALARAEDWDMAGGDFDVT